MFYSRHGTRHVVRVIPEKPNNTSFAAATSPVQVRQAKATLESLCLLKNEERTPEEVHALPVTSNQEYGFLHAPLTVPEALFHHPKGTCDVTGYADAYHAMTGRSPYATVNRDGNA
jgi:FAM183A and FAM183B related